MNEKPLHESRNALFSLEFFLFSLEAQTVINKFVVTNCSKERPGSIVTETLNNGVLIPIVTSKELHFNADFKYIISSSLILPIKSYEPEKIRLILENREKHPLKVIES